MLYRSLEIVLVFELQSIQIIDCNLAIQLIESKYFELSICDIGNITFHLTLVKYLQMLPRGKTVR
jgi:hypothetical protein